MNNIVLLFRHPLLPALICTLLWGSAFPAIKIVYRHWESIGLIRTFPLILLFAGIRFCLAGTGLLLAGKNQRAELRATPLKFILILLASYRLLIPVCGVIEALLILKSESADWGLLAGGSLVIVSMILARRENMKFTHNSHK